jgi:histone H2A
MDPQIYRGTGGKGGGGGGKGGFGGKTGGKGGKGKASSHKAAPTSRASKAGLQFPVGRIHRYLKARTQV